MTSREHAFDTWYSEVVLGNDTRDVAHEAFCAGWEAASPAVTAGAHFALAIRHTCACQSCKQALADLLTEGTTT